MKKLIIIPLLLLTFILQGQDKTHIEYGPVWMKYLTAIGKTDSIRMYFTGDTAKFTTSKKLFKFSKPIQSRKFIADTVQIGLFYMISNPDSIWIEKPLGTFVQRLDSISGGGGTASLNSGFLQYSPSLLTFNPYPNHATAPNKSLFANPNINFGIANSSGDSIVYPITGGMKVYDNGSEVLYITDKGYIGQKYANKRSTSIGDSALNRSTGADNTAIGYYSLNNNITGSFNTAIGGNSLQSNKSNDNTSTGYNSMKTNGTGNNNTATGSNSLYSNTTGSYNTAIGSVALYSNLTGSGNTAIGFRALFTNTAYDNTAIGYYALNNTSSGSYNTSIGSSSLRSNTTGANNSTIGVNSLYANSTGSNNTAIGFVSLYNNTTGSNNIAIGNYAGYYVKAQSNMFFLNGLNRTDSAGDYTKSIIVGKQDALVANQYLKVNAAKSYFQGDIYKINSSGDVTDTVSWDGGGTSGALMPTDTTNGKLQTQKMTRDNYHPKGGLSTLNISALAASASQFNLPSSTLAEDDEYNAVIFNTSQDNFVFEKPVYTSINTVADSALTTIGRVKKMIPASDTASTIDTTLFNYPSLYGTGGAALKKAIELGGLLNKITIINENIRFTTPIHITGTNRTYHIIGTPGNKLQGDGGQYVAPSFCNIVFNTTKGSDLTFTAAANAGDSILAISSASGIVSGDLLHILSTDQWGAGGDKPKGEIVKVEKVSSNNVYISSVLWDDYATATTTITKLNPVTVIMEGVNMDSCSVEITNGKNIRINNCHWTNTDYNPLMFHDYYNVKVINCTAQRSYKTDVNAQYGFSVFGGHDVVFDNNEFLNYNQAIITGAGSATIPNTNISYLNNTIASRLNSAQLDLHANSRGVLVIKGNKIKAGNWCIYAKGQNCDIQDNWIWLTEDDAVGIVRQAEYTYPSGGRTQLSTMNIIKNNHIFNIKPTLTGTVGIGYSAVTPNDTVNLFIENNFIDVTSRALEFTGSGFTGTLMPVLSIKNNYFKTSAYSGKTCYLFQVADSIVNFIYESNVHEGASGECIYLNNMYARNMSWKRNIFNTPSTSGIEIASRARSTICEWIDNDQGYSAIAVTFSNLKHLTYGYNTIRGSYQYTNPNVTGFIISSTVDSSMVLPNKWINATQNYTVVQGSTISKEHFTKNGNLTDGTPTNAELDTAIGRNPELWGIGCTFDVTDTNGTGLTYYIKSIGTVWQVVAPTIAP